MNGPATFTVYLCALVCAGDDDAGIEVRTIDGVSVRMYGAEKTLADCFKFRNKIGLDVALEALRVYRGRRNVQLEKVLQYARICRVENVLRPILEAIA